MNGFRTVSLAAYLRACTLCLATAYLHVPADESADPRVVASREVQDAPPFLVRVEVDRAEGIYRHGEEIQVRVKSERAGYLYLFYCDASRNVSCLFPNEVQSDNRIPAKVPIVVPAPKSRFRLRVGPPYGNEVLKAVVTTQPLRHWNSPCLPRAAPRRLRRPNSRPCSWRSKGKKPPSHPTRNRACGPNIMCN